MAVGDNLRHACTLAAAVVCGVACTEIVGQVDGPQGTEVSCLVFAAAVLVCGIVARAGHSAGIPGSEDLSLPCMKGAEVGKGGGPRELFEAPAGGGRSPSSPGVSEPIPAEDAPSWQALARCFSCCSLRDPHAADAAPPHAASAPPAKAASVDSLTARTAAGELRSRLADLLGAPESGCHRGADEVAVTTMERYGGERSCLARFLRARKCKAGAAEQMLRSTVAFRRRTGANHILDDLGARKVWASVRPLWAAAPVMFTAQGNVVIYFKMAEFLRIWQRGFSEEELRIFYISWMERMLALQAQGRARVGSGPDGEMPACIEVYDLQGIGLRHLRCLPGLRLMMRILRIGQDHYPENLHTAVMLNVPALANTPLQMVRSVLDVRTQAKLRLTWDGGGALLGEVLGVDREELLRRFHSALGDELLKDS